VSWDPRDDEPETPRRILSRGMCDCDMCNEDPAEETELDPEEFN
jgi:hypothetical protein